MKVYLIILTVIFILPTNIFSQVVFKPFTITTDADDAQSVYAEDVDGDGDMDVLSAAWSGDARVAWYENDGSQNFTSHVLTTHFQSSINSVYAKDIDSDGDIDLLSSEDTYMVIEWHENDGYQNFTNHFLIENTQNPRSLYAKDIDADGDMDVLAAVTYENKIEWYENDGNQSFTSHTISDIPNNPYSVYAKDVDGDGDLDVLSASYATYLNEVLRWHENDGNQNFTTHMIPTNMSRAHSVYAKDVDGDGDIDVLSGGTKIEWYENDGSQNFTTHIINTDDVWSVYAVDVDADGDMDVLSAGNGVKWYENDGGQNFAIRTINAENSKSVYAVDLDSNGHMDVLSATGDKIMWYQNQGVVGIEEDNQPVSPLRFHLYNNYPNPFNPETIIAFDIQHNIHVTLKIFDAQGHEVITLLSEWQSAGKKSVVWNGRDASGKIVSSGLYIYRIQAGDYMQSHKMLLVR